MDFEVFPLASPKVLTSFSFSKNDLFISLISFYSWYRLKGKAGVTRYSPNRYVFLSYLAYGYYHNFDNQYYTL